jgi:hypothetical protein
MQEQLKKALEFSQYNQTLSIQRKLLKEKIESKLTFGHAGGIFKIDRTLIVFVQMLLNQSRTQGVVLLDQNENPILVDDLVKFQDEILDRYFTSTNEYFEQYQTLKKSRSVEKLLEV